MVTTDDGVGRPGQLDRFEKKDVPENSPKILATFQVNSGDSSG